MDETAPAASEVVLREDAEVTDGSNLRTHIQCRFERAHTDVDSHTEDVDGGSTPRVVYNPPGCTPRMVGTWDRAAADSHRS